LERIKNKPKTSTTPTKSAPKPTIAGSGSNLKSEAIFGMMKTFLDRGEGKALV